MANPEQATQYQKSPKPKSITLSEMLRSKDTI
jgi:hypothetical protein